jgi:hypothetical protein
MVMPEWAQEFQFTKRFWVSNGSPETRSGIKTATPNETIQEGVTKASS